jgi:hypothetical protein
VSVTIFDHGDDCLCLQVGTLQQLKTMTADEIAKLKAGGRSIDELTGWSFIAAMIILE